MAFRTQRYGINTELRGARGVITNLNAIARALDATRLAATKTFQIDRQVRTLGVQAGRTARDINRLSMTTAGLSQATGVSIDKTLALVNAYQATGRAVGEFRDRAGKLVDQFDAMGASGAKNYRMMTELVGRFGIGAAAAVKMERTIGHLAGPKAFGQLLDKTTEFQQKFNMPGLIGGLPRVVDFAEKALTDFGHTVASNSQEIIYNTLQLGATYSKTFGVDAVEGINKAMEAQRRFLQQTRTDTNVFLGLASDFDPLTKALMETGLGLEQIQDLTKMGQQDPIRYAQTIRSMYEQLGGDQSLYARRFLEQVRQNSSEAIKQLITNEEALHDAIRTRNEAAQNDAAVKDFETMAKSVRSIGSELLNTVSNLALLGRTVIGLTFVEDFSEPISGAADALRRFNRFLRRTALQVKESKWFKEWSPRIKMLGKVLLGLGAAAGVVATTFAGLIIPFQTAVSVIRAIPVIGGAASKGMDALAGSVIAFGKGVLKPVGILAGLGTALNDFGKALKDPTISQRPFELLVRGLRAVSVGVVETFDNMLFGIPTTIAKWFYPKMRGTLGDVVKRLFTDLQLWLERGAAQTGGGWWEGFKRTLEEKINQFYNYLIENRERFVEQAREWGKNIGRAIGTLSKWAWDGISKLFKRSTWEDAWTQITDYFAGDGGGAFKTAWGGALGAVLELASEFTTNMFDEVLRPWGYGWIEVKQKFEILWEYAKLGFSWFKNVGLPTLEEKWLSFKLNIIDTFFAIKDGAKYAFDLVKGYALKAFGAVGEIYFKIREGVAWAQVKAAQIKYRAAVSAVPAVVALGKARGDPGYTARWNQLVGPSADALTQAETDYAQSQTDTRSFQTRTAGADAAITAAHRNYEDARKLSRNWIQENYAEDFRALDELRREKTGTLAVGGARFDSDKAQTERRIRQIEERDIPRIEARDRERRRDTAQRRLDATELQRIRPGLIGPLDKMVDTLQGMVEKATGSNARFKPQLEALLESTRNARRGIRNADTATDATSRFNTYMQWLDANYPGVRERIGAGADTSNRDYSAPPPVQIESPPPAGDASSSMGGDSARMEWGVGASYRLSDQLRLQYQYDDTGGDTGDAGMDWSLGAGIGRSKSLDLKFTYKMELDSDDTFRAEDNRVIRIMPQISW